jgi:hypothetical protein
MGMSIVISILVGYVLGYYALFYASYIWIALINLTLIFFIIGFYRGGYPTIRRWMGLEEEDKYDKLLLLDQLLKERKKLIKRLEEIERIIKLNPRRREYYGKKRDEILKEIEELDLKIDNLKEVVE